MGRAVKVLAGCLLAYAAIAWVFASQGRPNVDEGIFLGAARLVAEGQLPYRDFPFSQAPALPYAYAAAPGWGSSPLLGGRFLAWGLGLGGTAAGLWLALRSAGPRAVLFAWLVGLGALPNLWLANTARAQSLATPLLLAAAAALTLAPRGVLGAALAPSLLLWSTALRLTNGLVFACVCGWLAWRLRGEPARLAKAAGLVAAQALLAFAPALLAPRAAWFHLIEAQLGRGDRIGNVDRLPWAAEGLRRLGAYADLLVEAWLPALAVLLATGLWLRARARGARVDPAAPLGAPQTASLTLALLAAASFAPHLVFANAFPSYLMSAWALAAPAVGIVFAASLPHPRRPVIEGTLAVALLAAVAWNAAAQWPRYIGRGEASFAAFQRTARGLAARHGPDCSALTLETHLAVEAGCRLLPGLEYSHFSYFPQLTPEEAAARGVLDFERLREQVAAHPPDWIALAPAHPRILTGARVSRDDAGRLVVPRVAPEDFVDALPVGYAYRERLRVASGARRPGEPGVKDLWLYERR